MAKDILHMRIEQALKEQLRQLAEKDSRTLTNYIEKVLKEHAGRHSTGR
jgi:hypothetical protein